MCEHEEWIIRNEHSPWICANHQHGWENSDRQIYDSIDIAEWSPITTNCLQPEVGDSSRTWEFRNARGITNVNLSQNSRMELNREYVSDVDTNTDSDAELDYTATKCALRTCKCCCALADVPPADVPVDFKPVWNSDADTEKCNHGEWIIRNKQSPWICANHQHGWENSDRQIHDSMDITEWYPITTDCLQQEEGRRRIVRRRLFRGEWFRRRHRT